MIKGLNHFQSLYLELWTIKLSNCKYFRPGNLVQFRAVVTDQRLKPSVVGSIDVSMHDGNGNLIKKWDRVFTTKGTILYLITSNNYSLPIIPWFFTSYQPYLIRFISGVFAASIKLADAPVMGDWKITVDVSGQLFHQSFLVAEYILPKFDVDVIVPEYGRWVFLNHDHVFWVFIQQSQLFILRMTINTSSIF